MYFKNFNSKISSLFDTFVIWFSGDFLCAANLHDTVLKSGIIL